MATCEHLKAKIKGAKTKKERGAALQRYMKCRRSK